MASNYEELNDLHIDVLREIGNIGAGNAATSLGMLLNETVDIHIPTVRIIDFNEAVDAMGGPERLAVGVLVNFHGEVQGMIMFLLTLEDAKNISVILMGGMDDDDDPEFGLSDIKLSAIQEIGNILSAAYINSICTMTGLAIDITVPQVAIDMAGAILSLPMIQFGAVGDKIMFIEEGFFTATQKLNGNVIMFAEIESLSKIMGKLGIEM